MNPPRHPCCAGSCRHRHEVAFKTQRAKEEGEGLRTAGEARQGELRMRCLPGTANRAPGGTRALQPDWLSYVLTRPCLSVPACKAGTVTAPAA